MKDSKREPTKTAKITKTQIIDHLRNDFVRSMQGILTEQEAIEKYNYMSQKALLEMNKKQTKGEKK